jgi:hypothetical protein
VQNTVYSTQEGRSSGDRAQTLVGVGDRVQVRAIGGSPAARKYAGAQGRVTRILARLDGIILDVRIFGNTFDTVLAEGDLSSAEKEPVFVGLFSGLQAQSELDRLLDELYDRGQPNFRESSL